MDAPLKLAVPTVIGPLLASIGGLAGMLKHRTKLTSQMDVVQKSARASDSE